MTAREWANLFTIAVLKGSVEGDSIKHFGSTLEFKEHAELAVDYGLVVENPPGPEGIDNGPSYLATKEGLDFYDQYGLSRLPDGRAYYWVPVQNGILLPALEELNADQIAQAIRARMKARKAR